MQETSQIYKNLLRTPGHLKETKVTVGGVEPSKVTYCRTSGGLYTDDADIGFCISRTISMRFIPGGDVPRRAKIELFVRLRYEDQESEWIPKGVFYINTRETDKVTGIMTITGYDAMHGADVVWKPDQSLEFPVSMPDAVAEFARIMGVEIDPRTSLNSAYTIDYPANDYTIREELGFIAIAHAGNWIVSDAGKLLLVPLLSIPAETNYLVTEYGDAITFGGVRVLV